MVVNHINLKKFDNRISYLRIATVPENNRNRPIPSTNTSGFWCFENYQKRPGCWVAFINDDQGKKRKKSFA
jgi:hypothetical protein